MYFTLTNGLVTTIAGKFPPLLLLFPFIVPQLKGTQPQLKGWGTDGRESGMCAIFGERVHYRGRMEGSGGEPQCASDSAYYYTS